MPNSSKLIAFSKEQPARLLSHYLSQNGISAEYKFVEAEYAHAVFLSRLEDEEHARCIAEEFTLNPNDDKYQTAAWQSGHSVDLTAVKSFSLDNLITSLKASPFTACILLLCTGIYVLANLGISAPYAWLHIQYFDQLAENHQWWRILGPALIHFSMLHIVFNLLWWWSLGKQIEQIFGLSSLLLLFVISASLSNVAQLMVSGPNFGGLSGVVYGLVGCVWWLGWLKPEWGVWLPKPIIGFLLIWLVVGYMDILPINMANTAHTVGLICGSLFAWWLSKRPKTS
ncbi:rhomboid family intramembrane serine protease GlpG [Paraglaciecola aquimarina]|uniref:Rhomboid family intramembrane serine protease GlpG n=1 Tax=Paraglaciecola aquimarina TaxID=1235557 RepID=A0ABU3STY3_9ALTE|nr:rhomboid family intramembrane serine protease GlpG [Paraglaciecola aquimarina]MDU0353466.1 rhomboid family intramembrane serine protease GlpG [Paraglaciecola aquimarina]